LDLEKDNDTNHRSENKWLTLITVAINGFLIILDISIVNISFPTLTTVFETEPSVVLWVSVAYALVTVGLMPILGKMGDIYGRKKIFVIGYILFTVGLILCSLSQGIFQLILARIVQGVGGAMNMALSIAIVTDAFPVNERGKAIGIMSSVFAIGPLLGFTIGGLLLDAFGWRSVFYVRVPICIIGIIMAWKFLREQKASNISKKLDLLGTGALFVSLSCLFLFLNFGGRSGFLSPVNSTLGIIAVIVFGLFILQEKRSREPVVDLTLFENRLFTGGSVTLIIFGLAQAAQFFLFPFYLVNGVSFSSAKSGLYMAIPPLLFSVFTPLAGLMSDRIGSKPLCTAGMIFQCLGILLCSRFDMDSSAFEIITGLGVFGLGGSFFFSPNASLLMGAAPRDMLGMVGALLSTIRQVGMSSGVAIAGMILTIRQVYHTARLAGKNLEPSILTQLSLISGYNDTLVFMAIVSGTGIFTASLIGKKVRRFRLN